MPNKNNRKEGYDCITISSNVNGYTICIKNDGSTFRSGDVYVVRSKKELCEKIAELMIDVEE